MTTSPGQSDFTDALERGNHQGAGEWLVRCFAAEVFGLCLAIVQDRAHAEDLSQEVFASAFAALAGFRGESSARTWLLKIARNRCIDHLRKHKRWSSLDEHEDPDEVAEEVSLPSAILSRRSEIELALHELEEVERALIVLRFSHGLDYEELASAFGLKSGTTRMRVSRALAKMRDYLSTPRGVAGALAPEDILVSRSPQAAYASQDDAPRTTSRSRTAPMPAPSEPSPTSPSRQTPGSSSSERVPAQSAPPVVRAPAPAPASRSAPPPPGSLAPPSPPAMGGSRREHVLQSYFESEEAWLSINLQVRLREMAEHLPRQ